MGFKFGLTCWWQESSDALYNFVKENRERQGQVLVIVLYVVWRQLAASPPPPPPCPTCCKLLHQVHVVSVLKGSVQGDDVLMSQAAVQPDLAVHLVPAKERKEEAGRRRMLKL